MKIQYREFEDKIGLPFVKAGVDLLGQADLTTEDSDCLNSFNGAIDWKMVSSDAGVQGCEIIFSIDDAKPHVSLLETKEQGSLACHSLEVEAKSPEGCGFLSGLIHTVMSPAFVPSFVGVDWEDVKTVLRSGRRARLVLASGNADSSFLEVAREVKEKQGRRVQGLLLVLFLRKEEFALPIYRQATRLLEAEFDCSGLTLIAVPSLVDLSEPMLGLLAVYA